MKYPKKKFDKDFPNDDACLNAILLLRYGSEPACPKCGRATKFHRITGRRQYACQWCGHHVAPCAGTVFEKSTTPLKDWFYAMYLFTASHHGVPAKELERQLGVTYKCAWRIGHQLRKLMASTDKSGPLGGHVEIDETYIGGRVRGRKPEGPGHYRKRIGPATGKTVVMGMVERQGRVRSGTIKSARKEIVSPIIRRHVLPWATITTDEGMWYKHLKTEAGYDHHSVNHAQEEYVRGEHHVNTIEGFWSRLKTSIKGTHVHVSPKHLNKYVSEFSFRYNSRHAPGLMFYRLLSGLVLQPGEG